ncbi:hypothetical protein C8R45DRAFT_1076696 [Mycena sanguinolenta]|nr:hypothetical protein C8R45DRAFT_1076696 [Mycena sanguinolenta]
MMECHHQQNVFELAELASALPALPARQNLSYHHRQCPCNFNERAKRPSPLMRIVDRKRVAAPCGPTLRRLAGAWEYLRQLQAVRELLMMLEACAEIGPLSRGVASRLRDHLESILTRRGEARRGGGRKKEMWRRGIHQITQYQQQARKHSMARCTLRAPFVMYIFSPGSGSEETRTRTVTPQNSYNDEKGFQAGVRGVNARCKRPSVRKMKLCIRTPQLRKQVLTSLYEILTLD